MCLTWFHVVGAYEVVATHVDVVADVVAGADVVTDAVVDAVADVVTDAETDAVFDAVVVVDADVVVVVFGWMNYLEGVGNRL